MEINVLYAVFNFELSIFTKSTTKINYWKVHSSPAHTKDKAKDLAQPKLVIKYDLVMDFPSNH